MPPCMQTSVAPAAHASSTRSPTCVQRQRVGVGVGAPLGERAEPAAGVADVGEVDVPVHDVGDVVAVDVARGRRRPARTSASRSVPSAPQQGQVLGVGEPGRVALGVPAARPAPRGRRRPARCECPSRADTVRSRSSDPVAVDGVEVAAPVVGPPDGVDLDVQVDPARRRPGLVRLLPRQPGRRRALDGQPVAGSASAATCGRTRGSSHGSPAAARTAGGRSAARAARSRPRRSARPARRCCGQGRSGFTWSGVSGRDPAPVVDAGAQQQAELGRSRTGSAAPAPAPSGRAEPGDGDRGEVLLAAPGRRARRIAVSRLGPEVLDDDLLHVPVPPRRGRGSRGSTRPARRRSRRCRRSTPVVNGTASRPASSSTRSRTAGSLSGEPKCGPPRLGHSRVDVVSSIIPIDGATGLSRWISSQVMHAGVEVRQQPGLLEHPDRHRPQVGQRRVVAVRVAATPRATGQRSSGRSPRVNSASLQPSAAPCAGDVEHLVGGQERRLARRAQLARRRHERAVVAAVAAQPGERDEHLAAVGDHARAAGRRPGRRRAPGAAAVSSRSSGSPSPRPRACSSVSASAASSATPALGADERAAEGGLGGCRQRTHGPDASPESCVSAQGSRSRLTLILAELRPM